MSSRPFTHCELPQMSHPGRPAITECPHGEAYAACTLRCKYNLFEQDDLRIDSWELKCLDCGLRKTIAVRSDDEDDAAGEAGAGAQAPRPVNQCPFCGLTAACAGRDLCAPQLP